MTGARPSGTLRDWLRYAERRFRAAHLHYGHGTHTARDEAAWLLAHVLRLPHEQLEAALDRTLTPAERRKAQRLIDDRARTRRPLAYLLHEAWLGEHRFYVDERVIVPRSFIAELLRDGLRPWIAQPGRVRRALDMCTGSGCLAVLLALTFPRATVDAADIDQGARAVARRNVRDYKLGRRVRLLRSDLFAGLPAAQYDLIVANPPYVDARAMKMLPREYRHEPKLALAGGADGLRFVKAILRDARDFLGPHGLLVVEIGHNRRMLERAFPGVPFTWLETSAGDEFVFLLQRGQLPR
ncbi:MAG: 50S ribosomal protein L3 N(5)-glutamine methyltransferase [Burkholderiales bacterium]